MYGMVPEDLLTVLGPVSMTNYCGSRGRYLDWEEKAATPALKAQGFVVREWRTTESDSTGPLSRAVVVEKDGTKRLLVYG